MSSKKSSSCYFRRRWAPFLLHIFRDFAQISTDFKGFCLDFHQIKTFEGALAPMPPTPVVEHKIGVL